MAREAAHVQFVDDRLRPWPPQRAVAFPVVGRGIDDHAFHRRGRIVPALARRGAVVGVRNDDCASVRIQQHLARIEPVPARRMERSVRPVPVNLAPLHARHEAVPIGGRVIRLRIDVDDPGRTFVRRGVEEQEIDAGGGR
jgi:hypothetical protein